MGSLINRARLREDPAYQRENRLRAQTDLFFLAHEVLGYDDITEYTHRQVADFFVQKDPRKTIAAQDRCKSRLLLLPRGTFKTSFNIADTVQWVCDFTDVRILTLTASNSPDSPLADAFVAEVADHFFQANDSAATILHELFPECVTHKRAKAGWFLSPSRVKAYRDPTLMGSSIESSLSGWHWDVIKLEDIQDNRNSQTIFGLKKVKQNLFINLKMLMPWGYRDATGTRYGPQDVYGRMIETMNPKVSKMLWKPAMVAKPESRQKEIDTPELMTEADYDLFFPELLPYSFLMEKKEEDLHSYMTQYLNLASGSFTSTFPMERLLGASIDDETIPLHGTISIAWRMELGESNQVAGMVGLLENGRMYIVDLVRGSYAPSTLARKVVLLAKKHGCHQVLIEETPGAHHYEPAIRNEALAEGWKVAIRWAEFDEDDQVRALRVKNCEPLLQGGRLLFAKSVPHLKELHRQLYNYGLVEENELPDALARVCEALPSSIALNDRKEIAEEEFDAMVERDVYDRVYGLGSNEVEEVEEADEMYVPAGNTGGLEEIMPGLTG